LGLIIYTMPGGLGPQHFFAKVFLAFVSFTSEDQQ